MSAPLAPHTFLAQQIDSDATLTPEQAAEYRRLLVAQGDAMSPGDWLDALAVLAGPRVPLPGT